MLEESENFYITASKKTKVIESNGRRWFSSEPAISFFSKERWFNVIAMIKDRGVVFYVNLASPTLYHRGMLKYIDYDLDFKLFPDGYIASLDEREYEKHKHLFHYPEDLQKVLHLTAQDINRMLEGKLYPFQYQMVLDHYQKFQKKVPSFL